MRTRKNVALLIEAINAYARGLLHGVARYIHEHANWNIYFEPHSLSEPLGRVIRNWHGDGILARITSKQDAKAVLSLGVPIVELRRVVNIRGVTTIGPDNCAVGRLAAEHLWERGFRNAGFCGLPRGIDPPMDDRADAFLEFFRQAGCTCSAFETDKHTSWEGEQKQLARWIKSLPKPVGVMACNDDRGLQVLQACVRVGVTVPHQVAVIGAGNDDCLCDLAHPPLSSVDLAPETIGYEAAALLERLMSGKTTPTQHIKLPPRGIVVRLSTDVLATEDETVAKAAAFIRTHACDGLRVQDVLKVANLSRSALEPRFKQVLGRSVHQQIRHIQIERVKSLLSTTDLPLKQIAAQCGFRYVQYLAKVFRRLVGLTLSDYRKRMRHHTLPHRRFT